MFFFLFDIVACQGIFLWSRHHPYFFKPGYW